MTATRIVPKKRYGNHAADVFVFRGGKKGDLGAWYTGLLSVIPGTGVGRGNRKKYEVLDKLWFDNLTFARLEGVTVNKSKIDVSDISSDVTYTPGSGYSWSEAARKSNTATTAVKPARAEKESITETAEKQHVSFTASFGNGITLAFNDLNEAQVKMVSRSLGLADVKKG